MAGLAKTEAPVYDDSLLLLNICKPILGVLETLSNTWMNVTQHFGTMIEPRASSGGVTWQAAPAGFEKQCVDTVSRAIGCDVGFMIRQTHDGCRTHISINLLG